MDLNGYLDESERSPSLSVDGFLNPLLAAVKFATIAIMKNLPFLLFFFLIFTLTTSPLLQARNAKYCRRGYMLDRDSNRCVKVPPRTSKPVVVKPPTILKVEPKEALPRSVISIECRNCNQPYTQVLFNCSTPASADCVAVTPQRLEWWGLYVEVPNFEGSPHPLIVKNRSGHDVSKEVFVIHQPPKIEAVEPQKVRRGQQYAIRGKYFDNLKGIYLGGDKVQCPQTSAEKIVCQVPDSVLSGSREVRVETLFGKVISSVYIDVPSKPKPVEEKAKEEVPSPQKPVAKKIVTQNKLGNPEYCFGAVGKGCGGFGEVEGSKATRPGWLAAGCSEEVWGKRNCWVVPGSIKHDNCCVKYPSGKQCGGPGRNPFNRNEPDKDWLTGEINPAGEINHDGHCEKEWDDATWDVYNGRAWLATFNVNEPSDLTPVSSPKGRYAGGETVETARLCAPEGAAISARHHSAFCCSGNGKRYWAAGVEDWIVCAEASKSRSVMSVKQQAQTPPQVMAVGYKPPKPGKTYPKKVAQRIVNKPEITSVKVAEPSSSGLKEISVEGQYLFPFTELTFNGHKQNASPSIRKEKESILFAAKGDVEDKEIVLKTVSGIARYKIPNKEDTSVTEKAIEKKKQQEEARKKEDEQQKKLAEEKAKKEKEAAAKKRAQEEIARKRAQEESARKQAQEENARKQAQEESARKQAALEEKAKKQREWEALQQRRQAEEDLARRRREEQLPPSGNGGYCNPDVPRYNQPGCIEPPQAEKPPPTQGQPCNPGIPRYSQPGCVE